jgi:hypothetical protein
VLFVCSVVKILSQRPALTGLEPAPSVHAFIHPFGKEGFQMTVFTHDALHRVAG